MATLLRFHPRLPSSVATSEHQWGSRLSSPQVHFGSVAVYVGTEVTGIESSFDGSRVTAAIRHGSSSPIALDTADTYEDEGRRPSLVDQPGRTSHVRYVFDHTENSATLGLVAVDWASNDPTDYLAGGYWVHLASGSSLEAGAFVDGPELSLSDPPDLPVSGTASYEGQSTGLYAYRYGTDDPQAATGSEELGEFTGPATLTADFSGGTIEGCIGCNGTVYVSGVTYHRNGQTETFEDHPTAFSGRLEQVSIDRSNGTFEGRSISFSHPLATVTQSSGTWGGQFSNRLDSSGNPRLVVGTFSGQASTAGGSQATFLGVFGAGLQ